MTHKIQRNYKNGLFLMIFGNKSALLSLYNAMRGLFYFSRVYEGYIAEHNLNIYSKSLIKLPVPNYVVFYNGTKTEGDSCRELYEYSFLIEEIRKGLRSNLELPDAVDHAVDVCMREGILKDFLLRHRAEVKNMILDEFDLNKHIELEKRESYGEGHKDGEKLFASLTQKLLADARTDDLTQALSDLEYRDSLYREYHLK